MGCLILKHLASHHLCRMGGICCGAALSVKDRRQFLEQIEVGRSNLTQLQVSPVPHTSVNVRVLGDACMPSPRRADANLSVLFMGDIP